MKVTSLQALAGLALVSQSLAAPTWPASTDEIEELMFQTTGFRTRGFMDLVTPCSRSPNMPGRMNAAEWMRTCFHDMATHSRFDNTGGLDGSLMFETGRSQNAGPAFITTFTQLQTHLTVRSSISDILALSMYAAVRGCDGPVVPVRGGRIDAQVAGPSGVPQPEDPTGTFVAQFDRMGFSIQEMIEATACGHTLGGVHSAQHPLINPVGSAPNEYKMLDDPSQAASKFDHRIAADYILGNTTNPLVVGNSVRYNRHSDFRVFTRDNNVTIAALADPQVFRERCAISMAKIIDTVPPQSVLSDPIEPYEVKPIRPQLTLLSGGSQLRFAGEIRVRTTTRPASQITSVQLIYKDRNGGAGGTITATVAGQGGGFDDTFGFYSFSSDISSTPSISSFTVIVNLSGGGSETYDNNGEEFPVQDSIIYLAPQSCVDPFTNDLNQRTLTVVAAKRNDLAGTPVVDLTEKVARSGGVVVPALVPRSLPMTQGQTIGPYTLYSVSTQIGSVQSLRNSFDVTLGSIKDDFKKTSFMGQSCAPLGGGPTTTTTPPPVSSTTTTSTQPDPTATGWVSLGCYTDSVAARSLPVILGVPDLTNAKCQAACKVAGYTLAGTEYAAECFCGNEILNSGAPAASGCNMPCNGDASEMCGGPDRMNLWEWMGPDEPEPTPTSTSTPPAGPTGPTSVPYPGWSKVGCYTDSTGGRALSGDLTADVTAESGPMDNRKCVEACAIRGYSLAGTEYSGECFCGVVVGNGHGPADDGEVGCNMPCHGASGEYCGGSNRLTMWKKDDGVVEKRKVNLNKEWDHYQRRAMGWNL